MTSILMTGIGTFLTAFCGGLIGIELGGTFVLDGWFWSGGNFDSTGYDNFLRQARGRVGAKSLRNARATLNNSFSNDA